MILLKEQLIEEIKSKRIIFNGNMDNIGTNSIDITLNKTIKTYVPCKIIIIKKGEKEYKKIIPDELNQEDKFISMDKNNIVYEYDIPQEGLILSPGVLYLGSSNEIAGSEHFLPMYEGRSSTARLGFQSHLSAGFGDLGFQSNWTLEIIVIHPLLVFKDVRVGQVYFHSVDEDTKNNMISNDELYNSKYNNQPVAQPSKMYLDFQ